MDRQIWSHRLALSKITMNWHFLIWSLTYTCTSKTVPESSMAMLMVRVVWMETLAGTVNDSFSRVAGSVTFVVGLG